MFFEVGTVAVYKNTHKSERRQKYDGLPCVIIEEPDDEMNEILEVAKGSCIVQFECGDVLGVDPSELEFMERVE